MDLPDNVRLPSDPAASLFSPFPEAALHGSIVDRFLWIAREFPDRPAIDDGAASLSYKELSHVSLCVAASVGAVSRKRAGPVAILLANEPRYAAALLGVLAAGRAFVPLNAQHPPEHNQRILAHSGATVLVSDAERIAGLGERTGSDLALLDLDAHIPRRPARPVPRQPDDLACIAYTSGSTGQPKGVERHHRALLHYAMQTINAMEIRPSDTLLSFNGPSLTEGLIVTLSALLSGASVHCISPAGAEPAALAARLRARRPTVLWTVPRLFRYLVDALPDGERFDSLRLVSLAGDRVDWRDIDTVRRGCRPETRVRVGFGSTEAGVHAQWFVDETIRAASPRLPVGRAPPGQQLRLLGQDGSPVADGEAGEVEVTSASVSRAYWRDAEASERAFTAVPEDPDARRYRTGDLALRRPDGLIEYIGRRDGQVKLRGQRVELNEVETALLACPGVRDAAVTVRRNAAGVPRSLLAWCEAERGLPAPDVKAVMALLADRLPRHMVPGAVQLVPELPRLANFKIDREALRLRDDAALRARPADMPRTPTEIMLAGLWSEAFETPVIARDDDFFALGGDSLAAVTLAIGVRDATGQVLDLAMLADHPTLAALAAAIDAAGEAADADEFPLVAVPRDTLPPLSVVQEVVWRHGPEAERTAVFCDTTAYRLRGSLDAEALCAAIRELLFRHESLRTTFNEVDGRLVQIIHPEPLSDVASYDAGVLADPYGEARRLVGVERRAPFDLRNGPLIRFMLIRLGKNEHWLVNSTHHIVADAGSRALLLRELSLAYNARARGLPSPLAAHPPLQYADYAVWQRQSLRLENPRVQADMAWWCARLASVPEPSATPFVRDRIVADADPAEGTIWWSMPADIAHRTLAFARAMRTTPYVVRVAAFSALLAVETGCATVALIANLDRRDRSELRETMGNFLNGVTLRLDCRMQASFADWVRTVAHTVSEAVAHGETPLWQVMQVLRELGIRYPASIIVHSLVPGRLTFDGIESDIIDRDSTGMPAGFTVTFREHDEDRDCSIAFDATAYDPVLVKAFRDRFISVLGAGLSSPDSNLIALMPGRQATKTAPGATKVHQKR
ncbi:MAG: AMP-binding protein [Acetobacteraceae bacterium]